jgi:hypothetical protein
MLQQVSSPELIVCHASPTTRVAAQCQNPIIGQAINRRALPVGCNQPLEVASELNHWAQFGRLLGQQHEPINRSSCHRFVRDRPAVQDALSGFEQCRPQPQDLSGGLPRDYPTDGCIR